MCLLSFFCAFWISHNSMDIHFIEHLSAAASKQKICYTENNTSIITGGSRTTAASKMEHFVIMVNGWKPLTIITKSSILDVAAVPDPRLIVSLFNFSLSHWRRQECRNLLLKIAFQSGKRFDKETQKYNIKDTLSIKISFMHYMHG